MGRVSRGQKCSKDVSGSLRSHNEPLLIFRSFGNGRALDRAGTYGATAKPCPDELSVKIDKGDFLLDKLGAGRPNCAREAGMSCNEKNMKRRLSLGFTKTYFPLKKKAPLWSFPKG